LQTVVRDNIGRAGIYYFPAPENRPGMSKEDQNTAMTKAMERAAVEPTGILVVHPFGRPMNMPIHLARQFAVDFLAMMVASVLLRFSAGLTYGQRVVFVALMGLLPVFTGDIPLWNWYGHPAMYTIAQGFTHLVGYIVGGLVIAKTINPSGI
jgi:hypothetical protein